MDPAALIMKTKIVFLCAALVAAAGSPVTAQTTEPPPEIGIQEHLGSSLPMDSELIDENGHLVPLRDLITHPSIITFVYYRCPGICSPLLTELSHIVEKMDLDPGKDYRILTISFDHREGPELAKGKQESYLGIMDRPVDPSAWRFLSADSITVRRLTDAAGFYFKPDGNDFIHAGALIVVSPQGKIVRYINGIQYLPFDVKMALLDAGEGKVGPTIAKLLRLCYSYDPEGRTYALNFTRVAGLLVVACVAVFVVVFVVKPRTKKGEPQHG
jgi:protein SCO1/2